MMPRPSALLGSAVLALIIGSGCASSQPVLYPNAHYERVGRAEAERETAECRQLAEEHIGGSKTGDVAQRAGERAVVGGATGAVVGGIVRRTSAGRGAAAGAAAGAVSTVTREAFRWNDPKPSVMRFVNRCLGLRGYDVIAWE